MRNLIEFHYDGPITADHHVTARTLAATLTHLQSAIDRAVIELRLGRLHKHARLRIIDYPFADFEVGQPRDGGFILDLKNAGQLAIVDRIDGAIRNAYAAATNRALQKRKGVRFTYGRLNFANPGASCTAWGSGLASFLQRGGRHSKWGQEQGTKGTESKGDGGN